MYRKCHHVRDRDERLSCKRIPGAVPCTMFHQVHQRCRAEAVDMQRLYNTMLRHFVDKNPALVFALAVQVVASRGHPKNRHNYPGQCQQFLVSAFAMNCFVNHGLQLTNNVEMGPMAFNKKTINH